MKNKLLPCPFCGSENIVMDCNSYGDVEDHFALCNNLDCIAEGPTRPTEEAAITAWNTRTDAKHLSQLMDLLAIIHRDGGHYVAEHGLEKAQQDAIKIIYELRETMYENNQD